MKENAPTRRPLILVSNRLPVSLERDGKEYTLEESSGGLATALSSMREEALLWIGWPGEPVPKSAEPAITERLAELRLSPIFLSKREVTLFYDGFSNRVIWPLFHYFPDRLTHIKDAYAVYRAVNLRFAEAIAKVAPEGAHIWVHDFQLMLVPAMLRRLRPDLGISFFLHIPFPSSEIYRMMPRREELLRGLLGADYLGFHTHDYARHFRACCLRILGVSSSADAIQVDGRRIGLGVHPIGIPIERFKERLELPETAPYIAELARRYAGKKIIFSLERLDYTKGVPEKLLGYEAFLEREPSHQREIVLLQVVVPSRLDNPDYQELKREIDEAIGRINGLFGSPGHSPIEYIHRSLLPHELAAFYAFADLALITPLRDGMNLVAQEFVAVQQLYAERELIPPGALILSEFAGAATCLTRALLVNPSDIEGLADAIEDALELDAEDREERMRVMMRRVRQLDAQKWAAKFCQDFEEHIQENQPREPSIRVDEPIARKLMSAARSAPSRYFFLDYDGTLRRIEERPHEAIPDASLLVLLERLSRLPDTEICVVSGRDYRTLETWLGSLPISLAAEHGAYFKPRGGEFQPATRLDLSFMDPVEELFDEFAEEIPGCEVERKASSVAFHYRRADEDYAEWRARELRATLVDEFSTYPVEILRGHKVLEIRARGVHKGMAVDRVLGQHAKGAFVFAAGDDRTDLDLYRALPSAAFAVHIGGRGNEARYRVDDHRELRRLLSDIARSVESYASARA